MACCLADLGSDSHPSMLAFSGASSDGMLTAATIRPQGLLLVGPDSHPP